MARIRVSPKPGVVPSQSQLCRGPVAILCSHEAVRRRGPPHAFLRLPAMAPKQKAKAKAASKAACKAKAKGKPKGKAKAKSSGKSEGAPVTPAVPHPEVYSGPPAALLTGAVSCFRCRSAAPDVDQLLRTASVPILFHASRSQGRWTQNLGMRQTMMRSQLPRKSSR